MLTLWIMNRLENLQRKQNHNSIRSRIWPISIIASFRDVQKHALVLFLPLSLSLPSGWVRRVRMQTVWKRQPQKRTKPGVKRKSGPRWVQCLSDSITIAWVNGWIHYTNEQLYTYWKLSLSCRSTICLFLNFATPSTALHLTVIVLLARSSFFTAHWIFNECISLVVQK